MLKKIDMHVHCIEERGIPKQSGHFYPTVKELRVIYDKIGVEKGVLLPPGTCPEFTTERLSPREAKAIADNYNDTIGWWFCGIDPRFGNNNEHCLHKNNDTQTISDTGNLLRISCNCQNGESNDLLTINSNCNCNNNNDNDSDNSNNCGGNNREAIVINEDVTPINTNIRRYCCNRCYRRF